MSYSKAGKIKDFTPSPASVWNWKSAVHAVIAGLCFAFVAAVICGAIG